MKIIKCNNKYYLRTYENIGSGRFTGSGKEIVQPDYRKYKDVLVNLHLSGKDLSIYDLLNNFIGSISLSEKMKVKDYLSKCEIVNEEELREEISLSDRLSLPLGIRPFPITAQDFIDDLQDELNELVELNKDYYNKVTSIQAEGFRKEFSIEETSEKIEKLYLRHKSNVDKEWVLRGLIDCYRRNLKKLNNEHERHFMGIKHLRRKIEQEVAKEIDYIIKNRGVK